MREGVREGVREAARAGGSKGGRQRGREGGRQRRIFLARRLGRLKWAARSSGCYEVLRASDTVKTIDGDEDEGGDDGDASNVFIREPVAAMEVRLSLSSLRALLLGFLVG